MRKAVRFLALLITLAQAMLLTTGCWDYHEVHHISFITTIGIDYKDKKYVLYAQALSFMNIAQREGERPTRHKAVVGVATGDTVTDAMFNLYRSEQQFVYWGHISAIIFSRKALENVQIDSLVDSVNRFRELRYNVWVYGTDEPIDKLENLAPYFGFSPYDSRLMKPDQTYRQFSNIKPIYLNRFVSDYFENGKTVMIPKLDIDSTSWKEGGEQAPELIMNGCYIFSPRPYVGSLSEEELKGRRYMDKHSVRMPMVIHRSGKAASLIVLNKPRVKIRPSVANGVARFDVKIRLQGNIDELLQDIPLNELERQVEKNVEQQVRETFEKGKKLNADVLNLTLPLFRYHYGTWKRTIGPSIDMSKVELGRVEVSFLLQNTGKYKGRLR
ncbi:Ger(x)C family spore germination protein [Cohnella sp. AR92]|uniref:Ger(x)C family spore germination protein n=1 Tax=Cohnella sp. AR92 TaxID=648716 RepID=UPI001315AAA8|nr:Ger(x)C family spore germination protein [Cohnella sp. AR92]